MDPRNLETFIIKTVRTAHPQDRGGGGGEEGRRGMEVVESERITE